MLPAPLTFDPQSEAAFDALGNPVRRALLVRLGTGPASVQQLASAFEVSRPAISRHLAVLEAAGLVRHTGAGTRNIYQLDPGGFARTTQWLDRFWDDAEARLRLVAENFQPRGIGDE